MGPNGEGTFDNKLRSISIIWIGMICSLGGCILIVNLIQNQDGLQRSTLPYDLVRNIIFMVSALQFFITFVLRKTMLQVQSRSEAMDHFNGDSRMRPTRALAKYSSIVILTCALSEGIVVYGFILFMLFQDIQNFYILTGISAFALIMHRPKREEFERLIQGI